MVCKDVFTCSSSERQLQATYRTRCYVKKGKPPKRRTQRLSLCSTVQFRSKPKHIRLDTRRGVGGAGGVGGGAGSGVGRTAAETKSLDHRLGRAVDGALALAALEEVAVVLQGRVEVTAASDKLVELERLVLYRLVNDRGLVDLLVNRDGGLEVMVRSSSDPRLDRRMQVPSRGVLAHLDAVVLVHITLNDRLDDVVDVVVVVLDNVLALVDDGALARSFGELIAGGVERGELGLVLAGRNVLLCRVTFSVSELLRVESPSEVEKERDPPLISVVGTTFFSTCSVPCWVSRTGWTWCWTWWTGESTRSKVSYRRKAKSLSR